MKVVGLLCRDILLCYVMCRVLIVVVENEELVTFNLILQFLYSLQFLYFLQFLFLIGISLHERQM